MVRKQHVQDLLSDKIASRFVCIIDNLAPVNQIFPLFWRCLLFDSSKRRQSILVTSSLAISALPDSIQKVFTANYQCTAELLSSLSQLATTLSKESNGQPIYIFIDCLEWLLLDCPQGQEFDQWTRHLAALLLDLSSKPYIRRLVIAYSPLVANSASNTSTNIHTPPPTVSGAREVMHSLDQCCTSHVIVRSRDQGNESRLTEVLLQVLHRRALQNESIVPPTPLTISDPSSFQLARKPAFCELAVVQMDSERYTFQKFSLADPAGGDGHPAVDQVVMEQQKPDIDPRTGMDVLPYLEASLPHPTGVTPEPLVHYQPDCFDDIDDEDPDDDLDI